MILPLKGAALTLAASGLLLAMPATAAPSVPALIETSAVAQRTMLLGSWAQDKQDGQRGYGHRRIGPRVVYRPPARDPQRNARVWRGEDGRYYCRRQNGTTGLLVRSRDDSPIAQRRAGRGDRTLSAILGFTGGALLGRSTNRSEMRCR